MHKYSLITLASLFLGFSFSFLGLGLLWIGLNFYIQMLLSVLFFVLSFLLGRYLKKWDIALFFPALGSAPIAMLLVQFRDKEGSHLMPIIVVCSWMAGCFLGSYLGLLSSKEK